MNKAILHTIIIYTLSSCPYCIKAKDLLKEKHASYQEIEVSNFTQKERDELAEKSNGSRTVPQIFINDRHIGGSDALMKLNENGELDRLLKENS